MGGFFEGIINSINCRDTGDDTDGDVMIDSSNEKRPLFLHLPRAVRLPNSDNKQKKYVTEQVTVDVVYDK